MKSNRVHSIQKVPKYLSCYPTTNNVKHYIKKFFRDFIIIVLYIYLTGKTGVLDSHLYIRKIPWDKSQRLSRYIAKKDEDA